MAVVVMGGSLSCYRVRLAGVDLTVSAVQNTPATAPAAEVFKSIRGRAINRERIRNA
jgi:hypothetical protein